VRKPILPHLVEWSFGQCPGEEISVCHTYEFTRSSALIRETVKRSRDGEEDGLTQSLILVFPIDSFWIVGSHWWPEKPYLEIPAEERRLLIPSFCLPGARDEPAHAAPILDPAENLETASGRKIEIYVPPGCPLNLVLFAIRGLLVRDHADLFEPNKRLWRPKPGGSSTIEQCRADLKALGCCRLRALGYCAREAIALMKSHKVETYESPQAYSRAVKRPQVVLNRLENRVREFRPPRHP